MIDIDRHKGKLQIIEQEFKNAEAEEAARQREEEEIRVRGGGGGGARGSHRGGVQRRVQLKRHEQFEKARRDQKLEKQRVDRAMRREILSAARGDSTLGHSVGPARGASARGRVGDHVAPCRRRRRARARAWSVTAGGG